MAPRNTSLLEGSIQQRDRAEVNQPIPVLKMKIKIKRNGDIWLLMLLKELYETITELI
jgi:hypothetical protein